MVTLGMQGARQQPGERRQNPALRQRFEDAQALLKPLLGMPESHNGTAFYRAMNQLQAAYPDLSPSEIEALVAAVVRAFQSQPANR